MENCQTLIKVLVALLSEVTRLVWTREDADICLYHKVSNAIDVSDTITTFPFFFSFFFLFFYFLRNKTIILKVTILNTQHISQYLKLHIIFITKPLLHKIL